MFAAEFVSPHLFPAQTSTTTHACSRSAIQHMNHAQRMPGLRRMYSRMGADRRGGNNPIATCGLATMLQQFATAETCMAAHAPLRPATQPRPPRQAKPGAAAALPFWRARNPQHNAATQIITPVTTCLLLHSCRTKAACSYFAQRRTADSGCITTPCHARTAAYGAVRQTFTP